MIYDSQRFFSRSGRATRRAVCAVAEALETRRLLSAATALDHGPAQLEEVRHFTEETPTARVSVQARVLSPSPISAPVVSGTIEAIDFLTNASTTGFYQVPPDNNVATGPNHVINIVNATIQWWTKAGVQQNSQRFHPSYTTLRRYLCSTSIR